MLGEPGVRVRVVPAVLECIWNALVVLLVLPTFDDTGSLGYLEYFVLYHPSGSTLGDCHSFPCRE